MNKIACVGLVGLLAGAASGQVWVEQGDAPAGVPGRQDTVGVGALTQIQGAIDRNVGDHTDTYSIIITDTQAFYATLSSSVGNGTGDAPFDSRMWLWDDAGNILLGNDDTSNGAAGTLDATISDPSTWAGLTGGAVNADATGITLTPGKYLLSVSSFSQDPEDAAGNDMSNIGSGFTDLHGPNPAAGAFAAWEDFADSDAGAYTVELGGATFCVPTPGTAAVLGVLGLAAARRRR